MDDLDPQLLSAFLRKCRLRSRRAAAEADTQLLLDEKVVVRVVDKIVPTVAGLLAIGSHPQPFFPQLRLTFVRIPGTELRAGDEGVPRFIDNDEFDGPIGEMYKLARKAIERNMRHAQVVNGGSVVRSLNTRLWLFVRR